MKTKIPHLILAGLFASATALPAVTIVQWGEPGGDTGIVSANQAGTVDTTYVAGDSDNPTVGTNYYNSSTDRTPTFNAAASTGTLVVQDRGANADRFQYEGASGITSMLAWEDGLHMLDTTWTGMTLGTFSIEAVQRNGFGTGGTVQFLFEDSANQWHISDSFAVTSTSEASYDSYSIDSADLSWSLFTPHSGGSATIGAVSTPLFDDFQSVGFYTTATSTSVAAVGVRYFQVTAVPEPSSTALLGLGGLALALRRRRS